MGGQCLAKGKQQPWEKGIVGNDIQSENHQSATHFHCAFVDHFGFYFSIFRKSMS